MKFQTNYTQTKTSFPKMILSFAAGAAVGAVGLTAYKAQTNYIISDGMIMRKGYPSRPITTENGVIQVGSLRERVNDLLYEKPTTIKKTVEGLYATYLDSQ